MDEIREIAIEAGMISAEYNGFDRTKLNASEYRFAELLLKRAYSIITEKPNIGTSLAGDNLLKHFDLK